MKPNINKIIDTISGADELKSSVRSFCAENTKIKIQPPSLQAFFVAACFNHLRRPIGIVADVSSKHLKSLKEDLSSFLGDGVGFLPDYKNEGVAVSGFVSKSKQTFDRTYNQLRKKQGSIFLTNKRCSEYTFSTTDEQTETVLLLVGEKKGPGELLEKLIAWGYENVDRCVASNMVSLRGGILDFFPTYSEDPIRVEFFSDTIESIRFFNLETQRSTASRVRVEIQPPPKLAKSKKGKTLSSFLRGGCDLQLYITQEHIVSGGEALSSLSLFYEEVFFNRVDTPIIENRLDETSKEIEPLFLFGGFSPKKRNPSSFFYFSSNLSSGFIVPSLGLACFSLLGAGDRPQPKGLEKKSERLIGSLAEISWGDFLVHQDFGVGVYRGLSLVGEESCREENIKIEFADGGLVYVPLGRFDRVHKYLSVGGVAPKISKLGTGAWEKQKRLAKKSIDDVVDHLVSIHAARSSPRGFSYIKESDLFQQLEEGFPYEETLDQKKAIADIYKDMNFANPMDRLVYGDVGFGKTEVALRAAMRAVVSGRMVFFLTPTTILSDQHYITCEGRLGSLGVEVELLSRFKNKREQSAIIERIHKNKVDVLIGTHRILSEDVPTERLGLLIVDEEHRFGVKHKETIRRLKNRVDVLTLTATPIPRTLQQSLVGIRDTSKITTPPRARLPIETQIQHFDWGVVKTLLKEELLRGGQAYFLHNNIEQLPFYFEKIQKLFPNNSVGLAHGKMKSGDLEKTVLSFFAGNLDILLCTTIIESGLDVQNANTIIINEAQNLGLAQLYQIRGRVGRGERQAFCYLCIPKKVSLMPEAFQRLRAIEHHTALGSGYGVAMKDLEIRGAGNLFGYKQSGQISRIGFELYNKILSEALDKKNNVVEKKKKEKLSLVFSGSALIDSVYMPLVQDRLFFYQRISETKDAVVLDEIKEEVVDRFGACTKNIENLFSLAKVQCLLFPFPVSRCLVSSSSVEFVLTEEPKGVNAKQTLGVLQEVSKNLGVPFRLLPLKNEGLAFSFEVRGAEAGLAFSVAFALNFSVLVSRISS